MTFDNVFNDRVEFRFFSLVNNVVVVDALDGLVRRDFDEDVYKRQPNILMIIKISKLFTTSFFLNFIHFLRYIISLYRKRECLYSPFFAGLSAFSA